MEETHWVGEVVKEGVTEEEMVGVELTVPERHFVTVAEEQGEAEGDTELEGLPLGVMVELAHLEADADLDAVPHPVLVREEVGEVEGQWDSEGLPLPDLLRVGEGEGERVEDVDRVWEEQEEGDVDTDPDFVTVGEGVLLRQRVEVGLFV